MAFSPMTAILRQASHKPGEKLNILTFPTHERYETNLAKTGHTFYSIQGDNIKEWVNDYAPPPPNYILLDRDLKDKQLETYMNFDLILSQNKFGQYPIASQLARELHLPLISLEHTLPMAQWTESDMNIFRTMKGDIDVVISEYSKEIWGFPEARVIRHCVDTDMFKPNEFISERENRILSVVNDWINRDWCCNFQGWVRVTKDLPVFPVGATTGLSHAASSPEELAQIYASHRIFINTSTVSPIPTSLLEAMASGCACVTTGTCMIPEVMQNGKNGFMTNDEKEMRQYLELLLRDEDLCNELGRNARQTILEHFNIDRFLREWNKVFEEAANIPYIGVK